MTASHIINICDSFTQDQCREVLDFILTLDVKIIDCADGYRVNLDRLSSKQLISLKHIVDKVNKPIQIEFQI
jgi:hypothetical protein